MKKKYFVLLALLILVGISVGIYCYIKNNNIPKDNLLLYIQKNVIKNNSYSFDLKKDYDIEDKHIVIFTFGQNGNEMLGYAVFSLMLNGRYRYERFSSSNENIGYQTFTSENKHSSNKSFCAFYGIIPNKQSNIFNIVLNGREFREEIERNTYFIKVYPINEGAEISITPE